jgi:ribosomal 50S subunit-recycling heat shock protein
MRLDKFLKVSRLIKRRTVANDACDAGRVSANGRVARASYEVKTGDRISLSLGAHKLVVEVCEINEHATKEGASELYRVIEQN